MQYKKKYGRDKTYDRIVISEDLEPFANNDYEAIDRFIFDKLDNISDEATDNNGEDTPIILICSDRRTKSEQLLVKLFGIGVYNALLGQDRSIEEVCKLIRKPRTKKEAKIYYKIESEDVNYQAESEDTVSEVEIQNIRAHYRKLGKNEEAYVESFNNIASQYTDAQLKIIVKFLPLNVRAVLERDSSKYQYIMAFSGQLPKTETKKAPEKKEDALKIDFIENQLNKQKLTKPVIVPSAVNTKNVKKLSTKPVEHTQNRVEKIQENKIPEEKVQEITPVNIFELDEEEEKEPVVEPVKRGRGRPKKIVSEEEQEKVQMPKRGRGRPKKIVEPVEVEENEKSSQGFNLFELGEEEPSQDTKVSILPGFDDDDEPQSVPSQSAVLPGLEEEENYQANQEQQIENNFQMTNNSVYTDTGHYNNTMESNLYRNEITKPNMQSINLENLLTQDKKIVSFVGTSKNGTSFLVNNLAELFSSMGIHTAILDMTKNKNSYFIYTKNEEELRKVAINCMENLANGVPAGIQVNNHLAVYTSLPSEQEPENIEAMLATLVKNYSLVLIDSDFETPLEFFDQAQEIYLVQSMDILTIQPLTAFLRDLKAKNILAQEKLKIVINKYTKIRGLNSKVIIGGMAYYNDPSMSFMTELFNKDSIKYTNIPFDEGVYTRYLEGLVNCKISLSGYEKNFMIALKELGNMVYPLLNNKYRPVESYQSKPTFSSKMNSTLEQMKKNY
ncbi:MAG: hypothetical protein J6A04_02885 [Clostridia bacterium]|nr:hypothetical protein [Clostridia bacterium]